jgi:hypothetical protein
MKSARADAQRSRITAVSRGSSLARAEPSTARNRLEDGKVEHTVTSSSARASQAAKDSTVLVSGSVPASDSVESSAPVLPEREAPDAAVTAKRQSSSPPRPAAGQPPSPNELIAKPPPIVTMPRTHREVTEPARSRLTAVTQLTHLAAAAGRQQNLVLWLLGAAGWVVAGVLAGILFAKSEAGSPAGVDSRSASTATPLPDPARESSGEAASPPALPALERPVVPTLEAAALPTVPPPATQTPPRSPPLPRLVAPPGPSAALMPAARSQGEPPAPAAAPATEPVAGESINSPGF